MEGDPELLSLRDEKETQEVDTPTDSDGKMVLAYLEKEDSDVNKPMLLLEHYHYYVCDKKCTATLMYKPTMNDQVPILRLIEFAGGDVDIVQGCEPDTLLRVAVDHSSIKAIKFCIQHNVHAKARTFSGDEYGRKGTTISTGFDLVICGQSIGTTFEKSDEKRKLAKKKQVELRRLQKYLECD